VAIELAATCSRLLDPNVLLRRLADSLHALGQERWRCPSASTPCAPSRVKRRANTKLADIAAGVVDGHRLLPKQPDISC
jgi:hypothetical protein